MSLTTKKCNNKKIESHWQPGPFSGQTLKGQGMITNKEYVQLI